MSLEPLNRLLGVARPPMPRCFWVLTVVRRPWLSCLGGLHFRRNPAGIRHGWTRHGERQHAAEQTERAMRHGQVLSDTLRSRRMISVGQGSSSWAARATI